MFRSTLRAIPLVTVALALSCVGRILPSDSAVEDDGDAGVNDAGGGEESTTGGGGGDDCRPTSSASVFWPNAPGPNAIATDDATVYWAESAGIYSCPVSGCTHPTAVFENPTGVWQVAVDADNVYFVSYGAEVTMPASLVRCPKSGCTGVPELVADMGSNAMTFALDETSVYWTAHDEISNTNTVMRVGKDLTGQAAIPGAQSVDLVRNGTIFWISPPTNQSGTDGSIRSCPIIGCPGGPTLLAANQYNPVSITADDEIVYWTVVGDNSAASGAVLSCSQAGCAGAPTTIASGLDEPGAIAVDACGVYWANGGISMCEKPSCAGGPIVVATEAEPNFANTLALNARGIFWTTYQPGTIGYVPR